MRELFNVIAVVYLIVTIGLGVAVEFKTVWNIFH